MSIPTSFQVPPRVHNVTWCDLAPRTRTFTQTSIIPPWDPATEMSVEGRIRRAGIDLLQKVGMRVGLELDVCIRRAHKDTDTSWTQTSVTRVNMTEGHFETTAYDGRLYPGNMDLKWRLRAPILGLTELRPMWCMRTAGPGSVMTARTARSTLRGRCEPGE